MLDVFIFAILAEKTANSFATIAVFLEFPWFGPIVAKKIRDFSATIYGFYLPPVMKPYIFGRNLLRTSMTSATLSHFMVLEVSCFIVVYFFSHFSVSHLRTGMS